MVIKMYYVAKKIGPLRKIWHLFLTIVLRHEVIAFREIYNPYMLTPVWLCPGCLKYRDWRNGCADKYPHLCDDCYCEKEMKIE